MSCSQVWPVFSSPTKSFLCSPSTALSTVPLLPRLWDGEMGGGFRKQETLREMCRPNKMRNTAKELREPNYLMNCFLSCAIFANLSLYRCYLSAVQYNDAAVDVMLLKGRAAWYVGSPSLIIRSHSYLENMINICTFSLQSYVANEFLSEKKVPFWPSSGE